MNPNALSWALAQPSGSPAAALAASYLGGTLRVTVDGRTVEYRSISDLASVLGALYAATASSAARRPSSSVARLSDGFA
jgi:hypothetical protein